MSRLRVVHVVSVDKDNYYLNNLVDYSDEESVEYRFVTLASHTAFARSLENRGQNVYCLDALGRKNYLRAARELGKILRDEDPHIVHTHLFDPSIIGLTVAKRQGRATVLTRHHSDAIHVIPSPAKRNFYLGLEKYISRISDRIIAPSKMVRDILVDREGVPEKKVSIIPYGQTTERFDAVTAEDVKAVKDELEMGDGVSLVFVSRLFHRKGHEYLFDALSSLLKDGVNAMLYLVGDGDDDYQNELEAMCRRLGIENRVRFLGWRDDALAVMAASDVVVHPSLEDALSSAVIEAVMLEKPIVATDISGVSDSLGDGKYGEVVGPANAIELLTGLRKVLSNLGAAQEKARRGREYLLEYMDARRVADAHVQLYKSVVDLNK